ncbi:hypothetical protein HPG69_011237 [Diceros bicornis minor]|uniref:Uncharacterized protein n=1 Tax=Diceros bicornis minor TaxID=77932 RepID=A0A7J7FDS7_DICBM|nr:hypothetical protein HPG69_011237 [Diceros bicornis minor]
MATPQSLETPQFLHIRDSLQMVWVLKGNSLIAVPSSNNVKPVILALVSCTDQKLKKEEKDNLVYLGIRGMNLCLFCAEIQGQPTLQLKVSGCAAHEGSIVRWTFCFI